MPEEVKKEDEDIEYTATIDGARAYLQNRVPGALAVGTVAGASVGYYLGKEAAIYSLSYGLGMGVGGTAFYCGTYGLKCWRKTDDVWNYALSGGINGAWIVTGLAGYKRGLLGAVLGAGAGALLKYGGDAAYDTTRTAWIQHRKFTLENSKEKILDVRKPAFHPRDSTLPRNVNNKQSIIPAGPGGGKPGSTPVKNRSKVEDNDKPPPKKGWLW